MRKVTRVAVGATALAGIWGLTQIPVVPGTEPGFEAKQAVRASAPANPLHPISILNAEDEAWEYWPALQVRCGMKDKQPEWHIVRNDDGELELWARCVRAPWER